MFLFCGKIYAQDVIFSQNFLIPETMNSSFTGAIRTTKLGSIHRSQWRNLGLKTNSNYAYFDTYIPSYNLGFGFTFLNHKENASSYNFNQLNANFSLAFQISDSWYFRPSISAGFGSKSYGFQNLLLEDQININSNSINTGSLDPLLLKSQRLFFDFSSSILFNNEDSWLGLTLRHLNKPNISLTENGNVPLDMFISVHSKVFLPIFNNYRYSFTGMSKIYFLSNFMLQGQFNRLDLGGQYIYDDRFSLGIVAATSPIKNDEQNPFITSVNTFVGLKLNGFRFGYSYDVNTTKIGNTGGTHEFSVSYDFTLSKGDIDRFKCVAYF